MPLEASRPVGRDILIFNWFFVGVRVNDVIICSVMMV